MAVENVSSLDTAITIIGFIATISSLVLAIGAIWLSFVFYRMSNEASKETTTAAKDIQASVVRLEKIFDKLYSDTFSMMKDTVTDMRHHIWRKPPTSSDDSVTNNEEKMNNLKESISNEIISLVDEKLKSSENNEIKIKELENKIKEALDSGIQKTIREQAVPTARVRRRLLSLIRRHGKISVERLLSRMNALSNEDYNFKDVAFMNTLFELRENGLISWDGPPTRISSDDILVYLNDGDDNNKLNS
ncbi:hypothetical protein RG283_001522 [Serratia marcescens]|nr:hypothetical protein SME13J_13750 [Serratia marcescens]